MSDEVHETYSVEETRALGRRFASTLPASALVAFCGDLGSGKTAFIQGVCDYFDCAGQVSSPTFTIVNEYSGSRSVRHCDLYRLDAVEDMLEIGLDALFSEDGIILVEWAERALPLLPLPRFEVAAAHGDSESHRSYRIHRLEHGGKSILSAPQQMFQRSA
ncbi:tRNA (adenosine(37)-N6)-threonylcarbamoyltransferase complex ATPase subunit type 1 TsaE [bacterium]|nr:tRNA (adenosine(37)-N6)-threonylcarbamoyltransferase complex ATPase subunit type 1 TsaE [bacterium]